MLITKRRLMNPWKQLRLGITCKKHYTCWWLMLLLFLCIHNVSAKTPHPNKPYHSITQANDVLTQNQAVVLETVASLQELIRATEALKKEKEEFVLATHQFTNLIMSFTQSESEERAEGVDLAEHWRLGIFALQREIALFEDHIEEVCTTLAMGFIPPLASITVRSEAARQLATRAKSFVQRIKNEVKRLAEAKIKNINQKIDQTNQEIENYIKQVVNNKEDELNQIVENRLKSIKVNLQQLCGGITAETELKIEETKEALAKEVEDALNQIVETSIKVDINLILVRCKHNIKAILDDKKIAEDAKAWREVTNGTSTAEPAPLSKLIGQVLGHADLQVKQVLYDLEKKIDQVVNQKEMKIRETTGKAYKAWYEEDNNRKVKMKKILPQPLAKKAGKPHTPSKRTQPKNPGKKTPTASKSALEWHINSYGMLGGMLALLLFACWDTLAQTAQPLVKRLNEWASDNKKTSHVVVRSPWGYKIKDFRH